MKINYIFSIIPQATLGPALPVFKLSSLPPLPKSSSEAWTTKLLPKMLLVWPFCRLTKSSILKTWVGCRSDKVRMFPKSPTCLCPVANGAPEALGSPCVFCQIRSLVCTITFKNRGKWAYHKRVKVSTRILTVVGYLPLSMNMESMGTGCKSFNFSPNKDWALRVTLFQENFTAHIAKSRGWDQLNSCIGCPEGGSSREGEKSLGQVGGENAKQEEGDSNM